VSSQRHAPASLTQGNSPGTYCTGVWVGLRSGLDGGEKCNLSCPHRDSTPNHPACSESQYLLLHSGP